MPLPVAYAVLVVEVVEWMSFPKEELMLVDSCMMVA
jgi:hypothetical protein